MKILLLAATASLIIGIWQDGLQKGWYEGVTIYLAVIIIVIVTAANDYLKDKQFRKLLAVRKDRKVLVIRNSGAVVNISVFDLLVGDILLLKQGDQVPADCLLIEGEDFKADESNITGESDHLRKNPFSIDSNGNIPDPFLLSGSMVVLGKGTALVCAVGMHTRTGEAEEKLFVDEDEGTPLQIKLESVANFIG